LAGFLQCAGACGKRRGFSPAAAARHSQHTRVYTEFFQKNTFFFSQFSQEALKAKFENCKKIARIRFWCKKRTSENFCFHPAELKFSNKELSPAG